MRSPRRLAGIGLIVVTVVAVGVVEKAHSEAVRLITNVPAAHKIPKETPATNGMPFIDVGVTSVDGLKLVG